MGSEGVALAADSVRRCPPGGFHTCSSPGGVHAPLLAGGSPPAHPCRCSSTRRTTCLGKRGAVSGANAPYHDEASIRSASGSRGGDAPRVREVMCSECSRRAAPCRDKVIRGGVGSRLFRSRSRGVSRLRQGCTRRRRTWAISVTSSHRL